MSNIKQAIDFSNFLEKHIIYNTTESEDTSEYEEECYDEGIINNFIETTVTIKDEIDFYQTAKELLDNPKYVIMTREEFNKNYKKVDDINE